MHERYDDEDIAGIWSELNKKKRWQNVEIRVMQARVVLGRVTRDLFERVRTSLVSNPIDSKVCDEIEKNTRHDLNAFLEERLRFIERHLQYLFHWDMTSYDTEEPAFARTLRSSVSIVRKRGRAVIGVLRFLSLRYRFTVMMGETHGQYADLQTFGKRCLTWLAQLKVAMRNLDISVQNLKYSKLSGAVGNYMGIDPELEEEALRLLGFTPFYGATQIMPRLVYEPVAQAVCNFALVMEQIADDIWLGARSPNPIVQEHFGSKQKGSSAMPHKRNPITAEKIKGMARLARMYVQAIKENIVTRAERSIEQSSVERICWRDLFHSAAHSLKVTEKMLRELKVYPDNMVRQVHASRGCYAASVAKEVLKGILQPYGIETDESYRIVQLAAFNLLEPNWEAKSLRENPPESFDQTVSWLAHPTLLEGPQGTIKEWIESGSLTANSAFDYPESKISQWNKVLVQAFKNENNQLVWNQAFDIKHLLRNEKVLYTEILAE